MKITHHSSVRRQSGVALLITIIIVLVVAGILASYLLVTENEMRTVGRSQYWNSSMTLTEAGVEEALAFMNKYDGNLNMVPQWSTPASAQQDGWTISNNVFYVMTRVLDTNMGYYTVVIDDTISNAPVIYSSGYAYYTMASAGSPFMLAAAGVTLSTSSTIGRAVVVSNNYSALFPDGLDSIGPIALDGNQVTVDSFNSANPAYSDFNSSLGYGTYDSTKAESHGNVSTDSGIIDALNAGNAKIFGKVNTGPGGTIGIGPNGYVGPYPVGTGVTSGYSNDTMNVSFPDVVLPTGASGWPSVPVSGVITSSGNYQIAGITGSLTINAPYVTIYVDGSIKLEGTSGITIGTNVVNCNMYVAGPSADIGGNGIINMNGSSDGHAEAFGLYGLPTLTSLYIHGNGDYVGTVYAPEAAFTYKGSGNAGTFVGAAVVGSVEFTGNANFHYDESLATQGPGRGYLPVSWREVGAN